MTSEPLLRTPLYAWHAAHGARIVPFGGWDMPVQYSSIVEEHTATRTAAGVFDISHMGRITFTGPQAASFLDRLVTADVTSLEPGQIRYSLITNEAGGILDDVLVYRTPDLRATDHMLVVNASNRMKILDWIRTHLPASSSVQMQDRTEEWGMMAVQGPRSLQIVQPVLNTSLGQLGYYRFAGVSLDRTWVIVSRTGYTGEDGFELIMQSESLAELWERVIQAGIPLGLKPSGLGARDTLRLEAGMPLYGHELSEQINPLEAGLGFAVKLDKPDFIGKEALRAARQGGLKRRRAGLELEGKRIAREGYPVFREDERVGQVTSGTFGPTVGKSIAMAYVWPTMSRLGTALTVDIRAQAVPARVVKLPFYRRA